LSFERRVFGSFSRETVLLNRYIYGSGCRAIGFSPLRFSPLNSLEFRGLGLNRSSIQDWKRRNGMDTMVIRCARAMLEAIGVDAKVDGWSEVVDHWMLVTVSSMHLSEFGPWDTHGPSRYDRKTIKWSFFIFFLCLAQTMIDAVVWPGFVGVDRSKLKQKNENSALNVQCFSSVQSVRVLLVFYSGRARLGRLELCVLLHAEKHVPWAENMCFIGKHMCSKEEYLGVFQGKPFFFRHSRR